MILHDIVIMLHDVTVIMLHDVTVIMLYWAISVLFDLLRLIEYSALCCYNAMIVESYCNPVRVMIWWDGILVGWWYWWILCYTPVLLRKLVFELIRRCSVMLLEYENMSILVIIRQYETISYFSTILSPYCLIVLLPYYTRVAGI